MEPGTASPPQTTPTPAPRPVMDVSHPAAPTPTTATQALTTPASTTVAVRPAPVDASVQDTAAAVKNEGQKAAHQPHEHTKAVTPHFGHRPVGAIVLIVMAMVILSGLSILVYLNS